jgi:hypothetical protein
MPSQLGWKNELCQSEPNPLVARYEENTKEIRSILRPIILRLFFGSVSHLAKGIRKCRVATYFERVEGPPFLFVSCFYLPTYLPTYVGHTYVLNSDEGLTERAPNPPLAISVPSPQWPCRIDVAFGDLDCRRVGSLDLSVSFLPLRR